MNTHDQRPAWWQLLLLLPAMIGLVVLEAGARLSEPVHTAATVGILVLTYALVGLWVRANRVALTRANQLVTLVRRSQEKVVQGQQNKERLLARPVQAIPLDARQVCDSTVEREPNQALGPVPTPAETRTA